MRYAQIARPKPMRAVLSVTLLFVALAALPVRAQEKQKDEGPTSEKARKSFNEARGYLQKRETLFALDSFKKADKQDGNHCIACQKEMMKYAIELRDWKTAEAAAQELITEADGDKQIARAHYGLGVVLWDEAQDKKKDEIYARLHDEMTKALAASANFPAAFFLDGQALAHLKQDDAAKAQFQRFADVAKDDNPNRQRALRYIAQPDLARARMAPAFAVDTLDGRHLSLDDLNGKVVLLDFWATWCGPCREALPHVREIAKKFDGQPLVILSVSLDSDEQKWKEFIEKNGMTWLNYRDGGFTGPVSKRFAVEAIPHTFTIDADGVLQDEHIGDASIEGKLKKLCARAREVQAQQAQAAVAGAPNAAPASKPATKETPQ
jgi:thiol-disulfide isomerase/thioredoxin